MLGEGEAVEVPPMATRWATILVVLGDQTTRPCTWFSILFVQAEFTIGILGHATGVEIAERMDFGRSERELSECKQIRTVRGRRGEGSATTFSLGKRLGIAVAVGGVAVVIVVGRSGSAVRGIHGGRRRSESTQMLLLLLLLLLLGMSRKSVHVRRRFL
jgi:hypothetical protein